MIRYSRSHDSHILSDAIIRSCFSNPIENKFYLVDAKMDAKMRIYSFV